MRQATSWTYDNAGGPVPCLTIHNPLLVMSLVAWQAPASFVNSDEQPLQLHHYNVRIFVCFLGTTEHLVFMHLFHILVYRPIWTTWPLLAPAHSKYQRIVYEHLFSSCGCLQLTCDENDNNRIRMFAKIWISFCMLKPDICIMFITTTDMGQH